MRVSFFIAVVAAAAIAGGAAASKPWPKDLGRANLPFKQWYGSSPTAAIDGRTLFDIAPFDDPDVRGSFPADWTYAPTTHAMRNNPDLRNYYDPHFVIAACAPEGCETARRAAVLTWVTSLFAGTHYIVRVCEFDANNPGGGVWRQTPLPASKANDSRWPDDGVWWRDPGQTLYVRAADYACPVDDADALLVEMYRAHAGDGEVSPDKPLD